jgi:hypothetical protein
MIIRHEPPDVILGGTILQARDYAMERSRRMRGLGVRRFRPDGTPMDVAVYQDNPTILIGMRGGKLILVGTWRALPEHREVIAECRKRGMEILEAVEF